MNFTKKALLGLLFVNLIAVSPAFSAVESNVEEQQETSLSEKAYNFIVNKKTAVVVGLGIAAYVAYKYGAFDKVRNWFYGLRDVTEDLKAINVSNITEFANDGMHEFVHPGYLLEEEKSLLKKTFGQSIEVMAHYTNEGVLEQISFDAASNDVLNSVSASQNAGILALEKLSNFGKDYSKITANK